MFFFCKKSEIVVDCFTTSKTVFDTAKPEKAAKFMPDWWRNLPKTVTVDSIERPTMRSCRGFLDLYAIGFIQPLWCDVSIIARSADNFGVTFADNTNSAEPTGSWQRGTFARDKVSIMLISPWKFKEKNGLKFHTSGCFWNVGNQNDYVVVPGIMDFKYFHAPNISLFFSPSEKARLLEFNTPMVHYTPISEKKIKIKHHLVSVEELEREVGCRGVKFVNNYAALKNARCPLDK